MSPYSSTRDRRIYLVVKSSLLDHADEDVVGLAGDLYSLLGDVAEDANGNTRAADRLISCLLDNE